MALKGSNKKPVKLTVVGDGTVGKTCLLISFTSKTFPEDYVPTVFDNYAGDICVDESMYSMTLWDTAGQEEYERLRPLSYPNTECFILCFAVNMRASFDNIQSKWLLELRHHCPRTPILLVGTKSDLRDTQQQEDTISTAEGRKLRARINATKYVECSAKTRHGLDEVFQEAVRCTLANSQTKKKNHRCVIL